MPTRSIRTSSSRDFARQLRRLSTPAEQRLWRHLRDRALLHWKFRRQHSVGPYVADFYCHQARLIVELDGHQHADLARRRHDVARDKFMRELGMRVLRFGN